MLTNGEVPSVRLGRLVYRLPFAGCLRPLTEVERRRLAESIRRNRVRVPIFTYTSPTWGQRSVIDGGNRLEIAAELDLSAVPVKDLGPLSDEAAQALAISLNVDRRQLTAEEADNLRRERIEQEQELSDEGLSLRQIAVEVGVSHEQVRQDLQAEQRPDPAAPRPPERALASAYRALTTFRKMLDELLTSPWAPQVQQLLARHRADATAAALTAVLADLTAEAAQGFATE